MCARIHLTTSCMIIKVIITFVGGSAGVAGFPKIEQMISNNKYADDIIKIIKLIVLNFHAHPRFNTYRYI